MQRELAENPPAEQLLQLYFAAKQWWQPPQFADDQAAAGDDELGELEAWESPYDWSD